MQSSSLLHGLYRKVQIPLKVVYHLAVVPKIVVIYP